MVLYSSFRMTRVISSALFMILVIATLSACVPDSPLPPNNGQNPVHIGVSLALQGPFGASGRSVKQGYDLWVDDVNKRGGLLGRPVKMTILDDGSKGEQAKINYEKLIGSDKVDLVFGPLGTTQVIAGANVAKRYNYIFPAPTGSSKSVFNNHFPNLFVVVLPSANYLQTFSAYLLSRPEGQRPQTAAFVTVQNPFAIEQVNAAKATLTQGNIKSVFSPAPHPQNEDIGALARQIIQQNPDVVVLGTQSMESCVNFIKVFKQQRFNPKALIATVGPEEGHEFLSAVGGAASAEGIFIAQPGWHHDGTTYQNETFVLNHIEKFGGTADDISSSAAQAYAVGQLVEQAVARTKSIDNKKLMEELRKGAFDSLLGPLKFDQDGANTIGIPFLFQWQKGKLVVVSPANEAQANPLYPKPDWP